MVCPNSSSNNKVRAYVPDPLWMDMMINHQRPSLLIHTVEGTLIQPFPRHNNYNKWGFKFQMEQSPPTEVLVDVDTNIIVMVKNMITSLRSVESRLASTPEVIDYLSSRSHFLEDNCQTVATKFVAKHKPGFGNTPLIAEIAKYIRQALHEHHGIN